MFEANKERFYRISRRLHCAGSQSPTNVNAANTVVYEHVERSGGKNVWISCCSLLWDVIGRKCQEGVNNMPAWAIYGEGYVTWVVRGSMGTNMCYFQIDRCQVWDMAGDTLCIAMMQRMNWPFMTDHVHSTREANVFTGVNLSTGGEEGQSMSRLIPPPQPGR